MAKTGRPSSYSPEIADAICEEIATTDHALHHICERDGMPDHAAVYRWLASNEEFRDKYTRERERQADLLAGQILEISDDGTRDFIRVPGAVDDCAVGSRVAVGREACGPRELFRHQEGRAPRDVLHGHNRAIAAVLIDRNGA